MLGELLLTGVQQGIKMFAAAVVLMVLVSLTVALAALLFIAIDMAAGKDKNDNNCSPRP